MGVITGYSPFFSLPAIGALTRLAVRWVVSTAVFETELGAYTIYVDAYVGAEKTAFETAIKSGDDKAIISAAKTFIRFGA